VTDMRRWSVLLLLWVACSCMVLAQGVSTGPQAGGRPTFSTGINAARDVTVKQRLENQVPLDAQFTDENGAQVTLGKYFGKKPVWLVMPFYSCKNTCANMLHGQVESLHDPALKWQVDVTLRL